MVRSWFPAAVLLGAVIRLAALPLPGTHDVVIWKIWSYVASHEGVGRMYGAGGSPPQRRVIAFRGAETTVDYPPLALAELGATGRVYRWLANGRYPDGTPLIVALKTAVVLADAAFALMVYLAVSRLGSRPIARWATVAYWLNPAVVLDGAMLGYLDPLFLLPAGGSLVAAAFDVPALAGALAAASVLTKPQAILLVPAFAIAVVNGTGAPRRFRAAGAGRAWKAAAGAAAVAAAAVLPVVAAGGLPNMFVALSRLGHHDMLSGNACNLWWIVGYVLRAYYSMHDMGIRNAFLAPTRILAISRVIEIGYPNPRPIGIALASAAMLWGIWTARRASTLWLTSALGAFLVHAYATLAAQVHENHLAAAVPLLALAAAGRPGFVPVFAAVTAIVALNLNMFYGISEDIGYAIPRALTIIDLSVVVAAANCAALVWHAAVLSRECDSPAVARQAPAHV